MRCRRYSFDGFTVVTYRSEIIDSMSYLIILGDAGIVIDPHEEMDMLEDLARGSIINAVLTHEHFDHISGVNWLRKYFDTTVFASRICADKLMSKRNGTELFPLLLIGDKQAYDRFKANYQLPYRCIVDSYLSEDAEWHFGKSTIRFLETPGHTPGSISLLLNNTALFVGDVLLGNGEEFRSMDANTKAYQKVTLPKFIKLLSNNPIVFPGHGDPGKLSDYLDKQGFYHGT